MAITYKTAEEIKLLREGGKRLAFILHTLKEYTRPGVGSDALDQYARTLFADAGGESAFLGYAPRGSDRGFPGAVCVSVNEVVVHGIPTEHPHTFSAGDIVTIDGGLRYEGLITDSAITFALGDIPDSHSRLISKTRAALYKGIEAAQPGGHRGDIGEAISKEADREGYGIVEGLAGHGVGYEVHEDPFIPNVGKRGEGELLQPGLVIALEPMFTLGSGEVECSDDQFTISTVDHSLSAHFEHTIAITENGPRVLTEVEAG